ncbi:hypothetical protein ACO2Q8_16965 [Larkinella sp. VNQ87]|uniref:hypothetical protein n=1 Tax=Larkinella sp. VNQ87 TaxID=3400921 RepID=UPI003C0075A1
MGKRLLRIRATDVLNWSEQTAARLLQTDVHLVLTDGRTLHGRLFDKQGTQLFMRDHRDHTHTVPIQTLEEVILDEKAPF